MTNSLGLPENYEVPQSAGNYMRFQQGDNKFRILSPVITGYEYWNTENKPVRSKTVPTPWPAADARIDQSGKTTELKHFWAFVVWNYSDNRIQILEITQKGLMKSLYNYSNDVDMGSIQEYDIKVTREGSGIETRYEIRALPPKELDAKIKQAYEETDVDLKALYTGADPFAASKKTDDSDLDELANPDDDEEINPDDVPF